MESKKNKEDKLIVAPQKSVLTRMEGLIRLTEKLVKEGSTAVGGNLRKWWSELDLSWWRIFAFGEEWQGLIFSEEWQGTIEAEKTSKLLFWESAAILVCSFRRLELIVWKVVFCSLNFDC